MGPPVLYAKSGDIHIAYSVRGSGPDLVWCPGSLSHQELLPQVPEFAGLLDGPARFARLILFDKRGTGMSDRPPGIPTLEERIDDIRAVMDAAKSDRAHLMGVSEGVPMSILFAATYPQRTRSLILYGGRPKQTRTADYPWGPTEEETEAALQRLIARGWREDFTTRDQQRWLGSLRDDPEFLDWYARLLRTAATPGARIALSRMNRLIDVRDILPNVRVPTLVIARTGDPVLPPDTARDLAARIPGARFVLIEGSGHIWFGEGWEEFVATIKEWVTEAAAPVAADRFLATILFVDLVRSTERVAAMGDAAWRDLLARHYVAARRHLAV